DPTWPSIPYGTPLANQHFDVLDTALRQRPVWVAGDLYIGGAGVALGYWRDPQRTAASFITHPHTGQRLYRTGDLSRYLPDGTLEFLGRDDFQVKVNGFRVELGEIEPPLLPSPGIPAAAVCAIGARHADKHLAAYITLDADQHTPDSPELVDAVRGHLAERLPSYLVPAKINIVDRLPLTPNGKVDRTALARAANSRH